jgi:hypothetical protein
MPVLNSVTTLVGDLPDAIAVAFGKPQVAIGTGRDADRTAPALMPTVNR